MVTTRAGIDDVKGTVKVAVLEGVPDMEYKKMVAVCIYDTNLVHFLSTFGTEIKWMEKTHKTWDKDSSCMRLGRFLCLVINDSHNMNLNNVDVADQLRGSYRPDECMRKHKWWWYMFFWGHGTLIFNAFVAYSRYMEMEGKLPMSHYDFRSKLVLAKVDLEGHGKSKQQGSVAFQRGDNRGIPRKAKSKRTEIQQSAQATYSATKKQKTST